MTLEEIKTYLRVDGTDSDGDITALIAAAKSYIQRMTGKTKVIVIDTATGLPSVDVDTGLVVTADISTDELYNLANKLIIAHWYENRGVEIAGTLTKITHSVDAMVNHIAMCGDYV